jgi:hypothetical protein
MRTLLVATRKGLFVLQGEGASLQVKAAHFIGEPVSQVLADPRDGAWYAALRLGHFGAKLHKSVDNGATWREIACPALPPKPSTGEWADDTTPWSVDMVWSLAAADSNHPKSLYAGTMPAAFFVSEDGGESWQLSQSLWLDPRRRAWMGGGNDHPGLHTILVDPRNAAHVTIAISCGGVWQSADAGQTWALVGKGLTAGFMPPEQANDPNTQDPHCISRCAAQPDVMWCQLHEGQYRSADNGRTWQRLPRDPKAGDFGFAVVAHPTDPERAWFAPALADTHRYAPDGQVMLLERSAGAQHIHTAGLPGPHAYDLVYRHGLAGTNDGATNDGTTLAMASTTGSLWLSGDAGQSWQTVSTHFPPVAAVHWVNGH